jgi:hypothetical protein
MKKIIFLGLIVMLTIGTYAQKTQSPLEGAWQAIQIINKTGDRTTVVFPDIITGGSLKIYSKEHFVQAGMLIIIATKDTTNFAGGGTYKLDGNKYEENWIYHISKQTFNTNKSAFNPIVKSLLEIRNDTLYKMNDLDDNWNLTEKYSTEIYIRVK